MDRGECTAFEGYPQIIIVNENSKLAQSVAMARLSSKVGMGLRTQSCSGKIMHKKVLSVTGVGSVMRVLTDKRKA